MLFKRESEKKRCGFDNNTTHYRSRQNLACALAHKACREGYTALYSRLPRLFEELAISKRDGSYEKILNKIAKTDVLLLDDWGLSVLKESQRKDFLELVEERYGLRSTIIVAQLPITKWHELICSPALFTAPSLLAG